MRHQGVEPRDFAFVYLLGLLGLRIFETVGANSYAWAKSHARDAHS